MAKSTQKPMRRKRGFERAVGLVTPQIRSAGESRGFAVSKVLTHWEEIAGPSIAEVARPVNVSYTRGGFGATLTILTTGAQAPMLEMQKETLRERVNACYGYAAIKRVRITQTAPTGFAEGQALFTPKPKQKAEVRAEDKIAAAKAAAPVRDDGLRAALAELGANILNKNRKA